jgi:adenine-specific DNA-methyltransferase
LGFKIFETIPIWEDYLIDEKELTEETKVFDKLLFEDDLKALLLTWKTYDGLPLTEDCKEVKLDDYKAYYCRTNLYLIHSKWKTENIKVLLEKIDTEKDFVVGKIIIFGYNFTSKHLREIEENIRNYSNKKQIEIETILRF